MKKRYFILMSLLIFSMGCSMQARLEKLDQSISGSWEARKIISVYLTGGQGNYPIGNGDILVFKESKYKLYVDSVIFQEGDYTVGFIGSGKDKKSVISMTDYGLPKFFTVGNNTLILHDGTEKGDGTKVIYERVLSPGPLMELR